MPSPNLRDALLKMTKALSNGAGSTTTNALPTGKGSAMSNAPGFIEFLATAPALTTGALPSAATMTYDVVVSDNADLSSPTT